MTIRNIPTKIPRFLPLTSPEREEFTGTKYATGPERRYFDSVAGPTISLDTSFPTPPEAPMPKMPEQKSPGFLESILPIGAAAYAGHKLLGGPAEATSAATSALDELNTSSIIDPDPGFLEQTGLNQVVDGWNDLSGPAKGGITAGAFKGIEGLMQGRDVKDVLPDAIGTGAGTWAGAMAGTALLTPFLGPAAPWVGGFVGGQAGKVIGNGIDAFGDAIGEVFETIGDWFGF